MPGKLKKQQESSESENDNNYEKDGFVVDSDEDGEIDPQQDGNNSQDEEYNDAELSEDDYDLLEQNKNKKNRLKKIDDESDQEKVALSVHSEQFNDEDIDDVQRQELMEKLFDPTQRENLNQNDEDINKIDIPERIQIQYLQNNGVLLTDFKPEISEEGLQWIADKILQDRKLHETQKQDFIAGVKIILDSIRKEHLEVMYIYTYKKHLITSMLELKDYFIIQQLDNEWEQYYKYKEKVLALKMDLPEEIQANVNLFFTYSLTLNDLQNIKDYIIYQKIKIKCKGRVNNFQEDETQILSLTEQKFIKKEKILLEYMRLNLDDLLSKFIFSTDEYFQILQHKRVEINRQIFQSDEEMKVYIRQDHSMVRDQKDLLKSLQNFISMELFHHPFIKNHIQKIYRDFVLVSTEPTAAGQKEITMVNYLYPVKRIKFRPVKLMEDQIWLMALKAEEMGYIKIIFTISKELDKSKGENSKFIKDDVQMQLVDLFACFPFQGNQNLPQLTAQQEKLYKLRDYTFRGLLLESWYPYLEKQLRAKLKLSAQKHVVALCQYQFRQIINQLPYEHMKHDKRDPQNKRVMAIVLSNEPNNPHLLKSFTLDYTILNKHIGLVIVDGKGYQLHYQVFNYLTQYDGRPDYAEAASRERQHLLGLVEQYKPDTIVISASQRECVKLRSDLRDTKKFAWNVPDIWITLCDPQIPRIFTLSDKSSYQMPDLPPILREATSLARFYINPLAESLNLWHEKYDKNGCLHINMHPLQNMVSRQVLSEALERVAIDVVNSVGVDIVDASLFNHMLGQLQFVTGLGPRKAKHLALLFKSILSEKICNNNFESEKKIIEKLYNQPKNDYVPIQRSDIMKTQILGKTVFKNMQGFIKINNGQQPLDITRLSIKMYANATHIAKSAMDVQGKDDKQNSILRQLMEIDSKERQRKIDELELDDWASKKESSEGIPNFFKVVNFMRQELIQPFAHNYEQKKRDMTNAEIFYAVTQESQYTFKRNTIVSGPVMKINSEKNGEYYLIKLSDNGLIGSLKARDQRQQEIKLNIGQVVKCYVFSIPALEEQTQDRNINLFKVNLSFDPNLQQQESKKSQISQYVVGSKPDVWLYPFAFEDYEHKCIKTFDFDKRDQDLIKLQAPVQQKQQKLILRNINHPKFKQVLLKGALDYMQSQLVGEYIIRPSQRSREILTITWKFYENVIAHLQIIEQYQPGQMKPTLIMSNQKYDSFDEIFERYIAPCNNIMEAVANHKKFHKGSMEQLESQLREEKEKQEDIIPYGFCVTDKAPQYIVLMYMKEKGRVEKEFIKVKPDGLSFHNIIQQNLKDLILWFKKNFRQTEYKQYVRRTKAPYSENDKLDQLNKEWEIKREKQEKIKTEEQNTYNHTCSKCGKRGHAANDCRSSRGNYSDNKFRNNACHQCGQPGHMKRECPQNKRSESKDRGWGQDRQRQSHIDY